MLGMCWVRGVPASSHPAELMFTFSTAAFVFLQTLSNLAHVNDLSECAGTICMIQMTQLHDKVFSIGARGTLVMNLLEIPKVRLSYLADGAW